MSTPHPGPAALPFRLLRSELQERINAGVQLRTDGTELVEVIEGAEQGRWRAPALRPVRRPVADVEQWLCELERPRRHVLILLQAGALALGLWHGDELLAHKCEKKYVVRGKGKAQATYLRTKGKSRYGSRLRLRNHEALLVECSERLGQWWRAHGPFEEIFRSVPVRMWPELADVEPALPFDARDERIVKIPLHVHVPGYEELLRVHRALDLVGRPAPLPGA